MPEKKLRLHFTRSLLRALRVVPILTGTDARASNLTSTPRWIPECGDVAQGRRINEFQVPYRNFDAAIYKGLVVDIKQRVSSHDSTSVFSPMVHLTNTSGSGKTRSAIELGRLTNVIYCKDKATADI